MNERNVMAVWYAATYVRPSFANCLIAIIGCQYYLVVVVPFGTETTLKPDDLGTLIAVGG
jgi:hypothetical protein